MLVISVIVYLLFEFFVSSEGIIIVIIRYRTLMSSYKFTIIGSFSTVPESVVQAEGLNATFTCYHPNASATGWRLNGTSVNMRHPPNVITETTKGGNNLLTILATPEYNETTVQCFAYVLEVGNNNYVDENATTVLLIVQGIFITWHIQNLSIMYACS